MLSKAFCILGFALVAAQALSLERVKIENPVSIPENDVTFHEVAIPSLLEILEIVKDSDLDWLDLDEKEIKTLISTILEIVSNSDRVELCLLNIVRDLDREESMQHLRVLIDLGPEFIRLNIQKRDEVAECNLIGGDNPTIAEQLQKRRCINQVEAYLGTQITIVTIRIRPATQYYRRIARDVEKCVGIDFLPSWPSLFP